MKQRSRLVRTVTMMLAALTLAGCGCGPLGLRWCHGGGYYRGGPGGYYR